MQSRYNKKHIERLFACIDATKLQKRRKLREKIGLRVLTGTVTHLHVCINQVFFNFILKLEIKLINISKFAQNS